MPADLGVGIIGMGLMGTFHSRAIREVGTHYPDLERQPTLVVCADEIADRARSAAGRYGFRQWSTDWKDVLKDPSVEVVYVCTPNIQHREIATSAARAGKHVFCEKPVGMSPDDTAEIARVGREAGLVTGVGYVYRWAPLVQVAHDLIAMGRIGDVTHYRGRFLVGYGSSPDGWLTWRFQRHLAGLGVLGDLMSHVADMAIHLAGPIDSLVADHETFIRQRPLAVAGETNLFSRSRDALRGEVTNEDYAAALVRFRSGARGILQVSRVINGPESEMAFEVSGTKGAVAWNFERMNELEVRFVDEEDPQDVTAGRRVVLSGPAHPDHSRFYPGPAVALGYEDLGVIQAQRFLAAVAGGTPYSPGFADALAVSEVQRASQKSGETGMWAALRTADSQSAGVVDSTARE